MSIAGYSVVSILMLKRSESTWKIWNKIHIYTKDTLSDKEPTILANCFSKLYIKMQIAPRMLCLKVTSTSSVIPVRLMSTKINQELLLVSTKNNVTCLTMNNPKKLNGWTLSMLDKLLPTLENLSKDDNTKVG